MDNKPETPNSPLNLKTWLIYLGHLVIAILLTLLFIDVVGSRWTYYDIGINAATRNLTLLTFVAPLIFTSLLSGVASSWYLGSRYQLNRAIFFIMGLVILLIIFIAAFLFDLWRTADYPNPFDRTLPDFLNHYLAKWSLK